MGGRGGSSFVLERPSMQEPRAGSSTPSPTAKKKKSLLARGMKRQMGIGGF